MAYVKRYRAAFAFGFGLLAGLAVCDLPRVWGQAQAPRGGAVMPAAPGQPLGPGAPIPAPAGPPGFGPSSDSEFTDAITLPTDRQVKKRLEAAQDDYIKHESWAEASQLLQKVLNSKEDVFVQVRRKTGGQEKVHWVSARAEANRLLGTMPANGLQFYELQQGPEAKSLLAEARKKSDPQLLAEVAQRFFHTDAGVDATDLLGSYHLDRGRALMAALCYERLLQREGADRLAPLTLFKAALAFRLSGDPGHVQRADEVWKRLAEKVGRDGLRLDDDAVSLDRLKTELARATPTETASPHDWAMFRGNAGRSAKGRGSAPFLESKWQRSLLADRIQSETRHWIEEALRHQQYRPEPMLPAFFPVAVAGKLIYRSFWGVHAVDVRSGELAWDSPANAGLDALVRTTRWKNDVRQWFETYVKGTNQNIVFENSTVGTLSSDNTRVYWVDDLGVPPYPNATMVQPWGPQGQQMSAEMAALAGRSRLVANDVETGKIVWERGDPQYDDSELKDTYFLGPPLPLSGKLYVLTEKNGELRLVCLDAAKGEPVWTQTLATARNKLLNDVSRRVQAVHLAYGEGILVCPTNAGAVLGVDLLSRSLVWAFPYLERAPETAAVPRPGGMMGRRGFAAPVWPQDWSTHGQKLTGEWKMSAPIIQEGKVVFTAPDGSSIHCLDLRNGDSLWQAERRDDLYLAGVWGGKVLVVGKNMCRALSLANGRQLWQLETGLPSGQGVASGSYYYLPLKKGEVCRIDLERGIVAAHSASPKSEVPGNLVFYEGDVVSQAETAVVCYPQVEAKEVQITRLLEKNGKDPLALTERGELRLYKGDLAGAVADLRSALTNHPPEAMLPKTRAKLYATLTELLQRDFNAAEQYLDEYRELCKVVVPAGTSAEEKQKLEEEQRHRQAGFLCLLAKGREQQGRVLEAFQAYLDFGALAETKELVSVLGEPSVKARPDVWAQGRIAALVARSTAEQRKPLEAEIARRWETVRDGKDTGALRRFVAAFGSLFAVGREARLQLADRLTKEGGLLEAELNLLQLRQDENPQVAARAVDGLARLMTAKGLLEDAAYYYRILAHEFGNVVVRDGKTGAELFNELATDKRFLPYLEAQDGPFLGGIIKAKSEPTGIGFVPPNLGFEARTELVPFFQHHRLSLVIEHPSGLNAFKLKLFDRETNEERWSFMSAPTKVLPDMSSLSAARSPYYTKGHLVVLYLGHVVYALDLVERRKLWEKDLLNMDRLALDQPYPQYLLSIDPEGALHLSWQQNSREKLGQIGPVTASYVCLRTHEGLMALDPIRGDVLWTKTDLAANTHIFGDDQNVYLVDASDGHASSARAVRGRDGAAVEVADFASAYQHRQRVLGGRLLVSENDGSGKLVVRLYDVAKGADLWRKELPATAVVLRTEDRDLAGVIEPDGTVTGVDLLACREVFHGRVSRAHLDKVSEGLLLRDGQQFYVILNRLSDPNVRSQGPWPNFHNLRTVLVNGTVYAFERAGGQRGEGDWQMNWYAQVPNQALLVEQFSDLPMLVFSARYHEAANGAVRGAFAQVVSTLSIDKRTGKRLYDETSQSGYPSNATSQFHTLRIDQRHGAIDLYSGHVRLVHYAGSAPPPRVELSRVGMLREAEAAGQAGGAGVAPAFMRPALRVAPPGALAR
jgi:outer membrane protein assembly factor BamB